MDPVALVAVRGPRRFPGGHGRSPAGAYWAWGSRMGLGLCARNAGGFGRAGELTAWPHWCVEILQEFPQSVCRHSLGASSVVCLCGLVVRYHHIHSQLRACTAAQGHAAEMSSLPPGSWDPREPRWGRASWEEGVLACPGAGAGSGSCTEAHLSEGAQAGRCFPKSAAGLQSPRWKGGFGARSPFESQLASDGGAWYPGLCRGERMSLQRAQRATLSWA